MKIGIYKIIIQNLIKLFHIFTKIFHSREFHKFIIVVLIFFNDHFMTCNELKSLFSIFFSLIQSINNRNIHRKTIIGNIIIYGCGYAFNQSGKETKKIKTKTIIDRIPSHILSSK